ncbi:hypothetical protein FRB94_002402 [Tulasnella sp. JGI-2019a]|nr:hypothetical protein FRB94_002402 [Tulasnella sp. JGI-2019a]
MSTQPVSLPLASGFIWQKQYIAPGVLEFVSNHNVHCLGRFKWKHFECITDIQQANLRKRFNKSNVNELKGYASLRESDKARVDLLLGIDRPREDADVRRKSSAREKATDPGASHFSSWEIMQQHLDQYHDAWWRKSWSEAEHSLKAATELYDGDCPPQWCAWRMQIATAQSDWDEAVALAEEAEDLHPDSADVYVASALVALVNDRLPASLQSLQSALLIDPEDSSARVLLQRVNSIDQAAREGDRLYSIAEPSLASEKYTEALDVLGCVDHEGQGGYLRVVLLGNRAASFTQMKRFDLARNDCEAALCVQNHSWRLEILDKLARCHIALGDPTAAIQQAQVALKLDPLNSSILALESTAKTMQIDLERSQDAWATKNWLEARSALERVILECTGGYPLEWRVFKVEIEIATRNWETAISTAKAAAELHPSSPHGFAVLGLVLMLNNQLASCIAPLLSALRLDPLHAFATGTLRRAQEVEKTKALGDQAFQAGEYDEAVSKYTETLAIIGTDGEDGGGGYLRAVMLTSRATALQKLEKHVSALADILDSLELNPSSYEALCTHARIRMDQGYYEEAISIYTNARNIWLCREQNQADGQAIAQELGWAEDALEMSQSKDYYGILGIPRDATKAEIEKGYRNMNLMFHPDVGGNPEHFKFVSEAYSALASSCI